MYFQLNSCNTHAEHEWAQGTFLRQQRKVPPAHAQRVFSAPGQICPPFFVSYSFWREYEGRSALQVEGISTLTNTPAARGLEQLFSAVLKRFLDSASVLQELGSKYT